MNAKLPATPAAAPVAPASTFSLAIMDPAQFEHMQRVGKMLALSPLFPEHLRKGGLETGIANGVLVINMAMRLREDPLTVAQNIYFVGGKPGWMTTYLIAKANQHGIFDGPIEWKIEGKGDALAVTAYATIARSGRVVSVTCDMKLAKAEGWTTNKKYSTMPEQMLRYRSATWLIRLYCPEILVGVPPAIDNELPMRDVTPEDVAAPARRGATAVTAVTADTEDSGEMIDAETGEVTQAEEARVEDRKADTQGPVSFQDEDTAASEPERKPAQVRAENDRYIVLRDAILRDLEESGDVDGIRGFYGDQLDEMSVSARDVYDEVMAKMAKMEGVE